MNSFFLGMLLGKYINNFSDWAQRKDLVNIYPIAWELKIMRLLLFPNFNKLGLIIP